MQCSKQVDVKTGAHNNVKVGFYVIIHSLVIRIAVRTHAAKTAEEYTASIVASATSYKLNLLNPVLI